VYRRVLVLGWAWLPKQHLEGSGYNLVASELCAELAARGHRVVYLRSGNTYSVWPGMWIERGPEWRGVACHDLVNSPILSAAHHGFAEPGRQISSAAHTKMVVEFAREQRVDRVHVQSLEGFAFDVIAALRGAGLATVVTPHNYYSVCPQVDLLHNERQTCVDYEGGLRCDGCIRRPGVSGQIAWRRMGSSADRTFGPNFARTMRVAVMRAAGRSGPHEESSGAIGNGRPGDRARSVEGAVTDPATTPVTAPVTDPVTDPSTTQRLIENSAVHGACANAYGKRRRAGVAALNAASLVLCPSKLVVDVHASMGVERARLRHVPLGLPHLDAVREAALTSAYRDRGPWRCGDEGGQDGQDGLDAKAGPLRIGYFGSLRPNKGLATLLRAIVSLPADVLARCHFDLFAPGDPGLVCEARAVVEARPAARARVRWFGAYEPGDLAASAGVYDVGIVPNMGLETTQLVMLEFLAAGTMVVASDLGASREWVRHGVNGQLFPAGDCAALAGVLRGIVEGRIAVPARSAVRESFRFVRFAEYVSSVEACHEEAAGVVGGVGVAAPGLV
jgi:glycosyltransferase involved in cell wall biosynthesis